MNRKAGFQIAVALLAVAAIGVSATTFESTVTTDANDVIDLDYDRVPIGQEHAAEIVDRVERTRDARTGDPAQQASSGSGDSPDASPADSPGGAGASADPRPREEMQQQQTNERSKRNGETVVPPVDDLLALLPMLLVLAAFLAGVALIVHYGPRLDEYFDGTDEERSSDSSTGEADEWTGRPPANAVDRAWVSMVSGLDISRPATRTPNECAAAAIEAGFDRETVETLTEAFVAVRYGEQPVTESRERIATRSAHRFDGGRGT